MTYTPTTWVDNSTPAINATNLNKIESGISSAHSLLSSVVARLDNQAVYNVKDYGATGDGVTDDTAAIEAAITAAPAGTTVFFPAGVYLVSSPVRLRGGLSYLGEGIGTASGTVIRQATGANIQGAAGRSGLLVSDAFADDAEICSNPLLVQGLCLDGNAAANPLSDASGIVLNAFWSRIEGNLIVNVPGHGILLTDYTDDGTYVTNSCSENRVLGNRIDTCGGDGIRQECGKNDANLDGFCRDNLITGVDTGINYDRGAGWVISRNHTYGCRQHGIRVLACFATVVSDNYVEDFGGENAPGGWYNGLHMRMLDGWASHCVDNLVNCHEPAGTAHFTNFAWDAGFGQTQARAVIVGNTATGAGGTSNSLGFNVDHISGGVLTAQYAANRAFGLDADEWFNPDAVLSWTVNAADVGSLLLDSRRPVDRKALDVYGVAGQTADFIRVTDDANAVLFKVAADGTVSAPQLSANLAEVNALLVADNRPTDRRALDLYGAPGQTADYVRVTNDANAVVFKLAADGSVSIPGEFESGFGSAGFGVSRLGSTQVVREGASAYQTMFGVYTSVANAWADSPVFEVRANGTVRCADANNSDEAITLGQLQAVVAASTDFADFQSKVAAL